MKFYITVLFCILSFSQTTAQEHFNRLLDFGNKQNAIYGVNTNGSKINIHGRVVPSDTVNASQIFFAEVENNGDLMNFITLDRGTFMTNNLMNDIVFQDGKYISSFHENKRAFLVEINNNTYEVIDSFLNTLDPERPIQITDYFIDENQDVWYSGVDSRIVTNPPLNKDTRVFITKWTDPSEHFEMKNPISKAPGGKLVPMTDGYLFYTRAVNGGFPTPEGWGPESYFFRISKEGEILEEIKTEPEDQLDVASDIYKNDDDTFVMCGLETKKDPNSSGKVIRPIVFKFSFEHGIEWKVNPYGSEWSTSFEQLYQIIPTNDGKGYLVVGEDYTTDSLGTYNAGTLSKISNEGTLEWVKYYNSGYNAFHNTYDIQPYLDGYIFVGDVYNIVNGPVGDASFYGWMVYVNEDGEFDKLSSTIANPIDKDIKFNLYPNPTEDILYVKGTENQAYDYDRLVITNLLGQREMEVHSQVNSVDISLLKSGHYFVNFYNSGKHVRTEKFTKL